MKISYNTHPALKYLSTSYPLLSIPIKDKHALIESGFLARITETWCTLKDRWSSNIIVASKAFSAAADESQNKLLIPELMAELGPVCGVVCMDEMSIFYESVRVGGESEMYKLRLFLFFNQHLVCASIGDEAYTASGLSKSILDTSYRVVQIVLIFKKYASVETKYLKSGQRINAISCKYVNETKENFTYLDSKWFTTLVKSDAFKVRGHFRLQPKKKDGEWTKELIWITDFMKEGYTAPARKLSSV